MDTNTNLMSDDDIEKCMGANKNFRGAIAYHTQASPQLRLWILKYYEWWVRDKLTEISTIFFQSFLWIEVRTKHFGVIIELFACQQLLTVLHLSQFIRTDGL